MTPSPPSLTAKLNRRIRERLALAWLSTVSEMPAPAGISCSKPQPKIMNINLASLGLDKKELRALVVDKIVDSLMNGEDAESAFVNGVQAAYREEIKSRVQKLAEQKVLPKVEELLESTNFQETNRWGEATKPKLTLKEFLIAEAQRWMAEQVNYEGKPNEGNGYGWKGYQTRLCHMVHQHLHYEIERSVKSALEDFNNKLAKGLEETVKIKLAEALKGLQVSTSIKS